MCGLIGAASTVPIKDNRWFLVGRDRMSHRGPDNTGEWCSEDQRIYLGHRRLSIIDLSPLGNQPMHIKERGLSIVFNGEIYNFIEIRQQLQSRGHVFRTESDTEVLLASYAEWGEECLKYFNGAFVFALFDSQQQKLFIARDRAGEKPLFYYLDNKALFFSSELKALLTNHALKRKIDMESLDYYLTFGFIPGKRCILTGYQKLPPAHALIYNIKSGVLKVWRYWQLPEFDATIKNINESSLVNELEFILEDAVKKQLLADVPVGILLSGGLDSSLITAMAIRHSDKVRTFSVGMPGHGCLDETLYSRKIASHFKTNHTELMINIENINITELIPKLVCHFDEPIVDSSMIPTYLLCKEVKKYCTVALGGDGGDELFGGYDHYSRLIKMQQYSKYFPIFLKNFLSYFADQYLPIGFKGRNYLKNFNLDLKKELPFIASYFDLNTRIKLMSRFKNYSFIADSAPSVFTYKTKDILEQATRMDFHNYLAEDILVKIDRTSMANSLEIRSPFLDYRLIEFAFKKVPSFYKVNSNIKKILLKKLGAQILPKDFNFNRKQGFSIPLQQWLTAGPIRDYFWETLTSKDCLFEPKIIRSLFNGNSYGRNNSERLFCLVQFQIWFKTFNVSF